MVGVCPPNAAMVALTICGDSQRSQKFVDEHLLFFRKATATIKQIISTSLRATYDNRRLRFADCPTKPCLYGGPQCWPREPHLGFTLQL